MMAPKQDKETAAFLEANGAERAEIGKLHIPASTEGLSTPETRDAYNSRAESFNARMIAAGCKRGHFAIVTRPTFKAPL